MSPIRLAAALGLLTLLAAPALAQPPGKDGRIHVVFLKDGFVLQGAVQREGEVRIDVKNKEEEWFPKGFYFVDGGARRIIFSDQQVQAVETRPAHPEDDVKSIQRPIIFQPKPLPPLLGVEKVDAWDNKWNRTITFQTPRGNMVFGQHMQMLTPHYALASSTKPEYPFYSGYLTRELGLQQVRNLLGSHKDFDEPRGLAEATVVDRRLKAFQFFAHAGWHDEAERELDRLLHDYPGQKDRVQKARDSLKRLRTLKLYDELKRAHAAGRPRAVLAKLERFPETGLSEKMHAEARALREVYEKAVEDLKQARRLLEELPKQVNDPVLKRHLGDASATLLAELNYDHVLPAFEGDKPRGRSPLGTFLTFARATELQRKRGDTVDYTPPQLLSLAVTGWLQGDSAASHNPEAALRLWHGRQFALKYLRTSQVAQRHEVLQSYVAQRSARPGEALAPDEMARVLRTLPPIEPDVKLPRGLAKLNAGGGRRGGITYHLQLPAAYRHTRAWPVLIVLNPTNEEAAEHAERWRDLASEFGFILAAPEWATSGKNTYDYSGAEHAAVLDVLADLRRRFQVDSDRIFLTGCGQGGNMAYDVGLSHPSLFAGVVPMSAAPNVWGKRYKMNAQFLPFYVVAGDKAGGLHTQNRQLFEEWVPRKYPSIYIEYKGRGVEFFSGELPYLFEWMSRKRRVNPTANVGAHGSEFSTLRITDNQFYWLSTDAIVPQCLGDGQKNPPYYPATLHGSVGDANQITLGTHGLKQVTVWFPLEGKIDFSKKVTITANIRKGYQGLVKPDLEMLLEDVLQRGDRQRPFVAKVDLNL